MRLVVWVDSWQLQCCGAPFAVGETVEWALSDRPDTAWLTSVLGSQLGADITHAEDHHGSLAEDTPRTAGQVAAIRGAHRPYGPQPGSMNTPQPRADDTVILNVRLADGQEASPPGLHLSGYVVDLDVRVGSRPGRDLVRET